MRTLSTAGCPRRVLGTVLIGMFVTANMSLLAGCAGGPAGDPVVEAPAPSAVGDWVLVSIGGEVPAAMAAPRRAPTLRLGADLAVSGFAGVNQYRGALSAPSEGGVFEVGPLASTRMAGPPESNRLESRFVAALSGARTWSIEDGSLVLRGAEELRFEAGSSAAR